MKSTAMAVLRVAWAAWAGWTCKNLSKEVSIPQATLDSLYITVKGSRPATPAQPRKTRNKTPYSAHSSQAPSRGPVFLVHTPRLGCALLPHALQQVYRDRHEEAPHGYRSLRRPQWPCVCSRAAARRVRTRGSGPDELGARRARAQQPARGGRRRPAEPHLHGACEGERRTARGAR